MLWLVLSVVVMGCCLFGCFVWLWGFCVFIVFKLVFGSVLVLGIVSWFVVLWVFGFCCTSMLVWLVVVVGACEVVFFGVYLFGKSYSLEL